MAAICVRQPTLTEIAIADALLLDGGIKFRGLQEKWFPKIRDAYSQKPESGRRTHYGFSGAGDKCERALWMRWRWMNENEFSKVPAATEVQKRLDAARMKRLVNRGHLEEARFLALLEMIGVHIEDPTIGQERVEMLHGHAGSALDAVLYNTPCIPNEWQLGEFKTMNDKHFKELLVKGVRVKKPEHYVQMQLCMLTRGIHKTLYMVVNKNDDSIYTEIVLYDPAFALSEAAKIERIIFSTSAPPRISSDPTWFECSFCDCKSKCHYGTYEPERSCRTCLVGRPATDEAAWICGAPNVNRKVDDSIVRMGCDNHMKFNL